ncbi:MAG: hypothetical protein V8S98_03690 [Lachnospiraceae bacterium]
MKETGRYGIALRGGKGGAKFLERQMYAVGQTVYSMKMVNVRLMILRMWSLWNGLVGLMENVQLKVI